MPLPLTNSYSTWLSAASKSQQQSGKKEQGECCARARVGVKAKPRDHTPNCAKMGMRRRSSYSRKRLQLLARTGFPIKSMPLDPVAPCDKSTFETDLRRVGLFVGMVLLCALLS